MKTKEQMMREAAAYFGLSSHMTEQICEPLTREGRIYKELRDFCESAKLNPDRFPGGGTHPTEDWCNGVVSGLDGMLEYIKLMEPTQSKTSK